MPSEEYIRGVKDTIKRCYLIFGQCCQEIINAVMDKPETIEEVLKEK